MDTTTIVAILVIIGLIVAAAVIFTMMKGKQESKRLQEHYGSEYDRSLSEAGKRTDAERELREREERVEKLHITDLTREQQRTFADEWHSVQSHFVDDPDASINEADTLVQQVMNARGYPVTGFEQQAVDISVDHPEVVRNYRLAHAIALRQQDGGANTEDLRQAMVHYRTLFEELLGTAPVR